MSFVDSGCGKRDECQGWFAQESPQKRIKKTIGLLIIGNAAASLVLSKNVKADIIEISLKILLTLLLNFGRPSRNCILPSYLVNKGRRL